ncbi:fructosamine kinase family protein, partial [Vibrio sp. 378]|uniref:fructosamine kinase family protein n=1 Tax=Vibrio sp. 378 TaxID=3074603 RepID=UPI00398D32B0
WGEQKEFGFDTDNYLGSTLQPNQWHKKWCMFFAEQRIGWQLQLLKEKGIQCESIILVQKPFMERRAIATFEKQWQSPYSRVQVSSTAHPFFEYINEDMPLMMVLEALMEDFSRVKSYPEKGFQTKQDVPNQVDSSYQVLLERFGFDLV